MADIGILRAPRQRRKKAFGVIPATQTIIRFSVRGHWRMLLALVLLSLCSATMLGETIESSIGRAPVPQRSVALARTRRQPSSTPKAGRVWMPDLAATTSKLDLIERMQDGSLGHSAYFDISLDLDDNTRDDAPLAAYQEPQTVADPFALVLRGGLDGKRQPAPLLADKTTRLMPLRGEAINVSVAPVKAAKPVRRLVSMPVREEPIAAIEGATGVPSDEFERLAATLGTQSVKPGEELDLLVSEHPARPGFTQIVFARHVTPKDGERLLARRDDGRFQDMQEHGLYDRLLAEALSRDAVATGSRSADEQQAERDLRAAAAAFPHLAAHLAQAKVPSEVGLQVVALLRANGITWSSSQPPPITDVVYRKRQDGEPDLVSVSVRKDGKERQFYRYAGAGGAEFYDSDGRSVSKTLMHKPVSAGKLGDGFGWRMHPILQTRKFHNGVDFRAPKGSPIVAAGDGTVEKISWQDGYGKYVRIRHDGGYSTTYAHIEGTPKGLKVGQRVSQGQVIAYVGSTGLSTGPHLYYELRVGNSYADPTKAQMPAGTILRGRALDAFHKQVDRVEAIAAAIRTSAQSAAEAVGHALHPDVGRHD